MSLRVYRVGVGHRTREVGVSTHHFLSLESQTGGGALIRRLLNPFSTAVRFGDKLLKI